MVTKKIDKKELKKKIWEYFWKQKLFEIGIALGIIFFLTIFPLFIAFTGCSINPAFVENFAKFEPDYYPKCFSGHYWANLFIGWRIILGLFMLVLVLGLVIIILILVLGLVIIILSKWIYSNWEKAKERAREELKNA